MVNAGTYAYRSGYTPVEEPATTSYYWAYQFMAYRAGVALIFDEEAPVNTFSYDNATNTLTATAVDKTTDPVPAAGVSFYDWSNGTAGTLVNNAETITQTKTINTSGTVYFTSKDAYDNLSVTTKVDFYKYTFNNNYTGASEPYFVDYKMQGSNLPVPTAPSRTGYAFKGWSTSSSATSGSTSAFTTDGNTTLYAIWEKTYDMLTKPVLNGSFTYNGSARDALSLLTGFNSAIMKITGNIETNAGEYILTISLIDPNNYHWADDSINDIPLSWKIERKSITVSWGATTSFVYNGKEQGPTASATSGVTGQTINLTVTKATNVGTHTATATIYSVTNGDANNYTLAGATKAFTITVATPTITLVDKVAAYTGSAINIDAATVTGISGGTTPSGTITYTYYTNSACTVKTPTSTGASVEGGAPVNGGIYFVKATIAASGNYSGATSNVAKLTIGWDISKTVGTDDVFAYLTYDPTNSTRYILNIEGTGAMKNFADYPNVPWVSYRTTITGLSIEEGITTIGDRAFTNLQITSLNLPSTITYIGTYSFCWNSKLTGTVTIPKAVTTVGGNPFIEVPIEAIVVESGNANYKGVSGVLYTIDNTKLLVYPYGKANTSYTVLDGTTDILAYAFYSAKTLSVELPNSLKSIYNVAFASSAITNIIIPTSVDKIYGSAFENASELKTVYVTTSNISLLEASAFKGLKAGSIIYTTSKTIADKFVADTTYTSANTVIYYPPEIITHPVDVTLNEGGNAVFSITAQAGNPTDINYQWQQKSPTSDEWTNIAGATNSSYSDYVSDLRLYGYKYRCIISSSQYPNNIMTQAVLPKSLTSESATLRARINTFITRWDIPADADGVAGAGTTITLPILSNIDNKFLVDWGDESIEFYTTEGLIKHTYKTAGTYEIVIGGVCKTFGFMSENVPTESNSHKDYYTFTQYLTGILDWGKIELTRIGFANCINLAGTIPEPKGFKNITSMENMFYHCTSLVGPIPEKFTSDAYGITSAKNMFSGCSVLSGSIPADLFEDKAMIITFESTFEGCSSLSGSLPITLFEMGKEVTTYQATFKGCRNLSGMIPEELFHESPDVKNFRETFANCSGLVSTETPSGAIVDGLILIDTIPPELISHNIYANNFYRMFYNCRGLTGNVPESLLMDNRVIINISNDDAKYSDYRAMFEGCTGIERVSLNRNVIGQEMFKGCTGIKEIELKGTIQLGDEAFYGCNSLTNIMINEDYLTTIGNDAFEYTGTNPAKLATKVNLYNKVLVNYNWNADNRILDIESPKGRVKIVVERDPFTKDQNVELDLEVSDNYSLPENCEMAIINEDTYEKGIAYPDLEWQPFEETVNWRLTDEDGAKIVYVYYRDEVGNVCEALDYIDAKIKILSSTDSLWNRGATQISLATSFLGIDQGNKFTFRKEINVHKRGETGTFVEYTTPIVINEEGETFIEAKLIETTTGTVVDQATSIVYIDSVGPEAVNVNVVRGSETAGKYYGVYYGPNKPKNGVLINITEGEDFDTLGNIGSGVNEIRYSIVKDGQEIMTDEILTSKYILLEDLGEYAVSVYSIDRAGNESTTTVVQAKVEEAGR